MLLCWNQQKVDFSFCLRPASLTSIFDEKYIAISCGNNELYYLPYVKKKPLWLHEMFLRSLYDFARTLQWLFGHNKKYASIHCLICF